MNDSRWQDREIWQRIPPLPEVEPPDFAEMFHKAAKAMLDAPYRANEPEPIHPDEYARRVREREKLDTPKLSGFLPTVGFLLPSGDLVPAEVLQDSPSFDSIPLSEIIDRMHRLLMDDAILRPPPSPRHFSTAHEFQRRRAEYHDFVSSTFDSMIRGYGGQVPTRSFLFGSRQDVAHSLVPLVRQAVFAEPLRFGYVWREHPDTPWGYYGPSVLDTETGWVMNSWDAQHCERALNLAHIDTAGRFRRLN